MTRFTKHRWFPRSWLGRFSVLFALTGFGLWFYVSHLDAERQRLELRIRSEKGFVTSQCYSVYLTDVTPDATSLELLQELYRLGAPEILRMESCTVDNKMLEIIGKMTWLRTLGLRNTNLGDAEMKQLAGLRSVHTLNLSETPISDAGLWELRHLPSLNSVSTFGTKVTFAGRKRLFDFLGRDDCDADYYTPPDPADVAREDAAEAAREKEAHSTDSKSPSAAEVTVAGDERNDNFLKLILVWCPPGKFMMGSPKDEFERGDDEDQREVTLTKGFWVGKFEVMQSQYMRIMGTNPSSYSGHGESAKQLAGRQTWHFPVDVVRYSDALEFCRILSAQERDGKRLPAGWEYTLPTEAQWEYACRAGTTTPFSFGDSLNGRAANCNGNYPYGTAADGRYLQRPRTVGTYSANPWGLHDMHGNVSEWCRDWYGEQAAGGVDPGVVSGGAERVVRGGDRFSSGSHCRSAFRTRARPDIRGWRLGFRIALSQVQ
jgi:formylglycine-generating enzyme required for sulfatase activity